MLIARGGADLCCLAEESFDSMKFRDLVRKGRILRVAGPVLDAFTAFAAFILSYVTAYGERFMFAVPGLEEKGLAFVAIFICFYWLFSANRGSWRYFSIPDMVTIVKVVSASVIAYTIAAFLMTRGSNVPRSVPVLTLIYLVAGLSFSRTAYRLLMERSFFSRPAMSGLPERTARNVLLYGLTDNAESFIRANRRGAASEFNIVGILDDGVLNQARIVQGVKVVGGFEDLELLVERFRARGTPISELIDTEEAPSRQHLAEVVQLATRLGIRVSRIPDFTETAQLTGQSLLQPKPIDLSDLLGRPEIAADLASVARLINGRVVLVTGAGGSIGSELCRQIAEYGPAQLVLADASELHLYRLDMELRESCPQIRIEANLVDVRDNTRVEAVFERFRPNLVFHAAALKHVPIVEENPVEGIKTNLLGTRNVAEAAVRFGASNFVLISTDKAVKPTNVMGASKRAAEAYCQSLDIASQTTLFTTVRFGNVLGSNGSVVPRFEKQIAEGGPVTVTHPEITRFFMSIPEAVCLVLNAAAAYAGRKRGDIVVLDMGKPVRIVDLAERMIQLAGLRPYIDIDIVFTGLRPGEKLHEELFDSTEILQRGPDMPYFAASPRVIDKEVLHKTILFLEQAVEHEDRERAVELLRHIVPEFRPGAVLARDDDDYDPEAMVIRIDRKAKTRPSGPKPVA